MKQFEKSAVDDAFPMPKVGDVLDFNEHPDNHTFQPDRTKPLKAEVVQVFPGKRRISIILHRQDGTSHPQYNVHFFADGEPRDPRAPWWCEPRKD